MLRPLLVLLISLLIASAQFVSTGPTTILLQGGDTEIYQNGACNTPIFDPLNPNNLYVATVSGGVWMTSNANDSPNPANLLPKYTPLTDNTACNGARAIAFDSSDPNLLCVGCGDFSSNFINSHLLPGVYCIQRNDTMPSWELVSGSSLRGLRITQIFVNNGKIQLTTSSLEWNYVSTNDGYFIIAGGNVQKKIKGNYSDMVATTSGVTLIACPDKKGCKSSYFGIYNVTSNENLTPQEMADQLNSNKNNFPRIIFASTNDASYVYAMVIVNNGTDVTYLWSSINGATFTQFSTPNGITASYHHAAIAISPTSNTIVYLSGAQLYKDPDQWPYRAGVWYANLSSPSPIWKNITENPDPFAWPHSDTRGITFNANHAMLLCTDGGLYICNEPLEESPVWTYMGGNIAATELFSASRNPFDQSPFGGCVDNGLPYVNASIEAVGRGEDMGGGDGSGVTTTNYDDQSAVLYFWSQVWGLSYCIVNNTDSNVRTSL